jgi:hypothetical protein
MPEGGSHQESTCFCRFLKKNGNRIMKISFRIENEVINREIQFILQKAQTSDCGSAEV